MNEPAVLDPKSIQNASIQHGSTMRSRVVIFGIALAVRVIAGALFFGSVDLINSAVNSLALAQGKTILLPYFPAIEAFIWFGGVLAAWTPIPLPLCLKIVPILFDALMSVLIFDWVARRAPQLALRAGLLYAASPVALLITSFHGQWDAIALFFLLLAFAVRCGADAQPRRQFFFGALFGVSLLIKPIALPFLLLFPQSDFKSARPFWAAIGGLSLVLLSAFAIYAARGYPLPLVLMAIASNSAKGIQVLGLPFAPGLATFPLQGNRLVWLAPAMSVLAKLHYHGKLAATDAMLLFYLVALGTAGIAPQYLVWPIPLLLISTRLRLAAVYSAIATFFLLLYYMNPWASFFAFENLATFAPMRGFEWLLPPAALAAHELLPFVHALGNIVFPASALIIAFFVIRTRSAQLKNSDRDRQSAWPVRRVLWYLAPGCVLCGTILAAKLAAFPEQLPSRLSAIYKMIPNQYALHVQSLSPAVVTIDSGPSNVLNIVTLIAVLATMWCILAVRTDRVET